MAGQYLKMEIVWHKQPGTGFLPITPIRNWAGIMEKWANLQIGLTKVQSVEPVCALGLIKNCVP